MEITEIYDIFKSHPVVTTDSRDCPVGSMFFALKGESFDGNKFAASALEKGCSVAVVDDAECVPASDERYILVDDVLKTFQQLALHHRRALGTRIVGITGTNGKTTTKELTAAVLSEKYNVLYTQGNFNNSIGVPKTLLRLTAEHDMAVIEMGASHPGDIKELVDIVEPDCGLITNVGRAHLQGFGSFEGVVRTKGELYDFLRPRANAVVFIDAGNEHLMSMSQGLNIVRYGLADDLYVSGRVTGCSPMLQFSWNHNGGKSHDVSTHLIGSYNVYNMLAAAAVGLYFGCTEEQVCHALGGYVPKNNRSEFEITPHNRLVIDAYNANPTSMAAALRNFSDMEGSPKMVILGEMRELGAVSREEHGKIVDYLSSSDFDKVWLVGNEFEPFANQFRTFHNVDEVKAELEKSRPEGHLILIKGSNGTKLFQLPPLL